MKNSHFRERKTEVNSPIVYTKDKERFLSISLVILKRLKIIFKIHPYGPKKFKFN